MSTALILARKGSQRIANKNMALLAGVPLLWYTLECSLHARCIHQIVVSTDSDEIVAFSEKWAISKGKELVIHRRSFESATNHSTSELAIHNILTELPFLSQEDYLVLLPVTSPLRRSSDVDNLCDILVRNGAESGQTISSQKIRIGSFHDGYFSYYDWAKEVDMRKVPLCYYENSAAYIFNPAMFLDSGRLYSCHNHVAIIMESPYDMDINYPIDFFIAEKSLEWIQQAEKK